MKFEHIEVMNFPAAMRAMRNTYEPLSEGDSGICKGGENGIGCDNCCEQSYCTHEYDKQFKIGKKDMELAQKLIRAGSKHRKFLSQIFVSFDVISFNKHKGCYETNTTTVSYEELGKSYICQDASSTLWISSLPYAKEFVFYRRAAQKEKNSSFFEKKD